MQKSVVLVVIEVTFTVFVLTFDGHSETQAMPQFGRKYGVSCAVCHTSPPRLNETGYKFRAAGFRFPYEIGKGASSEHKFDILNYTGARVQVRYDASRSQTGAVTSNSDTLRLQALEWYALTGAWGKYISSNIKLTFTPTESSAAHFERAYVKANAGYAKRFFGVRAGIMQPFDGYGASDSPATISRPFIQSRPANFNQSTFFTSWGFDQTGVEVGYDVGRTSVRASVLKGLVVSRRNNQFVASAAQGAGLSSRPAFAADGSADYQLFINHILHPSGGGVSFEYYHGDLSLPIANTTDSFRNNFNRTALYGSYPVAKRLHLFTGAQLGRDRTVGRERFSSVGAFAEAFVPFRGLSSAGIRYDWFDPACNRSDNEVHGLTAYVNTWFYQQFRLVTEYQRRNTKRGSSPEQKDDAFQARFIFIK